MTIECTRCGAIVVNAVTEGGATMAMDPDPIEDGAYYVMQVPRLVSVLVASRGPMAKLAKARGIGRYSRHADTCVKGAAMRKKERLGT